LNNIYQAWTDICEDPELREAERWICLAEKFPDYGLNSLYHVIVKEAHK